MSDLLAKVNVRTVPVPNALLGADAQKTVLWPSTSALGTTPGRLLEAVTLTINVVFEYEVTVPYM
jgi:hypothetical protein